MDPKNLPGSLKAAIIIQSLGQELAQTVLKRLTEAERQIIQSHMAQLGEIPSELGEKILAEFTEIAGRNKPGLIKDNVVSGKRQGKNEPASSNAQFSNLKIVQSLKPDDLADLIRDEHPQTIAVIVVHLKPDVASEVLSKLPDEIKTDVALRILNLGRVKSEMIEMIDRIFEEVLRNRESSSIRETGGIRCLAEILNQTDENSNELILREIEEIDPDLVTKIKERMFVFEDLIFVDDKGMQKVLRTVETKELAIALKAASDTVKDKIFRNMSERASEMLKEEIEVAGAVRMKEVEEMQQMITKTIQELESKGEIIISGRRGEEIIG